MEVFHARGGTMRPIAGSQTSSSNRHVKECYIELLAEAEAELTAFRATAALTFGESCAQIAAELWLDELCAADGAGRPRWRQITGMAASRLVEMLGVPRSVQTAETSP